MQEASDAGLSDRNGSVVDFLPDLVRERSPQFPSVLSSSLACRACAPLASRRVCRLETRAGRGSANRACDAAGGLFMTYDLSRVLPRSLQNEVMDGETQGIHRFRLNRSVG